MGFNLGSTRIRTLYTGQIQRYYFESAVVRLMKEFDYSDVYSAGLNIPEAEALIPGSVEPRSIIIYRYYDLVSRAFGHGEQIRMEEFGEGLSHLILRLREQVCNTGIDKSQFKVYLVGHSMGGLVIRCFLQNESVGSAEAKGLVDKVFTYATPHNGIEFEIVGNVPSFFTRNSADNFARPRMCEYLGLPPNTDPVNTLNGKFDVDRFFCLVGTNPQDYLVASGWSARLVGPFSDGLVRTKNAVLFGPNEDPNDPDDSTSIAPRAYVFRSHSGYYGIVNSEEGYQNLTRFLFGNVRVDGVLEIRAITLPPELDAKRSEGSNIRASYHFESITRVRGALWDLSRRVANENSAVFRTYGELFPEKAAEGVATELSDSNGQPVLDVDQHPVQPVWRVDQSFVRVMVPGKYFIKLPDGARVYGAIGIKVMYYHGRCKIKDLTGHPGELKKYPADPANHFFWPYLLFTPTLPAADSSKLGTLLVVPNNTAATENLQVIRETAKCALMDVVDSGDINALKFAKSLGTPILVPLFPRPELKEIASNVELQALTRASFEEISQGSSFERVDRQLMAMIDDARNRLAAEHRPVQARVLMAGFSAAGSFTNRFTVLHPERVLAAAVGSPGGWPIAPVAVDQGETLRYPVGIADVEKLTKRAVDFKALRRVHFLFFVDDADTNDSAEYRNCATKYHDCYSDADAALINRLFGETMVKRWGQAERLYHAAGVRDAEFKIYHEGAGHKVTDDMRKDIEHMFREALSQH